MPISDDIRDQLTTAMRERDEVRRTTLRFLTAAIKNAEIDAGHPLSDDEVLAVIQKQAKQRRESIEEYRKADRIDLVDREESELAIVTAFLPKQADPAEIEEAARAVIAETGASGPRDIGKVMPVLVQRFAGRADGGVISETVRRLLAE